MYAGYFATIGRDIPYTALQFSVFEGLDNLWYRSKGKVPSFVQSVQLGAMAAVVSSAATLPIDVLKSNIMVSGGTLASTARSIVAARGVGALYSGFPSYTAINIAKWSVSMAVFRSLRGPDAGH